MPLTWTASHVLRCERAPCEPRPPLFGADDDDGGGRDGHVDVTWHPSRATFAAAVDRDVYVADGVTGAALARVALTRPALALAHAPANLHGILVVLLSDGSLHAVDDAHGRLRELSPPVVSKPREVFGGGPSAPSAPRRRGLVAFSGSSVAPWAAFATAGETTLRFARLDPARPPGVGSASTNGPSVGQPVKLRGEHKKPLTCVAGHPDAPLVAAGYADGTVKVYDVSTHAPVATIRVPPPRGAARKVAPPPPTALAVLPGVLNDPPRGFGGGGGLGFGGEHRGGGLVVGDASGRLTVWPVAPASIPDDGGVGASESSPASSSASSSKAAAVALELVAESNAGAAAVLALSTTPGGRGFLALVAAPTDRDRPTGGATTRAWDVVGGGANLILDAADHSRGSSSLPRSVFPPLQPGRRVAIASHPSLPLAAAVSSCRPDVPASVFPPSRSPHSCEIFLSEATTHVACALGRELCESVVAESTSPASVSGADPPPRPGPGGFFLRDNAVWAVDLGANGPEMKPWQTLPPVPSPGGEYVRLARSRAQGCFLVAAQAYQNPPSSSPLISSGARPRPHSIVFVRGGGGGGGVARHPGEDAAFVGANDACFAVLAPGGTSVSLFSCAAPETRMAAYAVDEPVSRLFTGVSPRSALAAATIGGRFGVLRLTGGGGSASTIGKGTLAPGALRLHPGEAVVQAAWQALSGASAGGLALLTTARLSLLEWTNSEADDAAKDSTGAAALEFEPRGELSRGPRTGDGFDGAWDGEDVCGPASDTSCPTSCLWIGPSLVFTRRRGGLGVLGWDGEAHPAAMGCALAGEDTTGGALLCPTEDGVVIVHPGEGATGTRSLRAASRPLALMDVLAVGWGGLARRSDMKEAVGPAEAMMAVAGRVDAARVSAAALDAIGAPDALNLPGLAADVARVSTHLDATWRAEAEARAWRSGAAVETTRRALNAASAAAGFGHVDGDESSHATSAPASARRPRCVAAALRTAATRAARCGDAGSAFAAAAMAVGATAGIDPSPLLELCRNGVAAPGGDGGFPAIERDVATKLAPGPIRAACEVALGGRRAARGPMRLEPAAGAGTILGSASQHRNTPADWLGRPVRVAGSNQPSTATAAATRRGMLPTGGVTGGSGGAPVDPAPPSRPPDAQAAAFAAFASGSGAFDSDSDDGGDDGAPRASAGVTGASAGSGVRVQFRIKPAAAGEGRAIPALGGGGLGGLGSPAPIGSTSGAVDPFAAAADLDPFASTAVETSDPFAGVDDPFGDPFAAVYEGDDHHDDPFDPFGPVTGGAGITGATTTTVISDAFTTFDGGGITGASTASDGTEGLFGTVDGSGAFDSFSPDPRLSIPEERTTFTAFETSGGFEDALKAVAEGMRALEANDFAAAEAAFRAATGRAARQGGCPGPRALEKCRSYALAARLLRACRDASEKCRRSVGEEASDAFRGEARGGVERWTLPASCRAWASGERHVAAGEMARLARRLAALPLDGRHRREALRFAATWNLRAGRHVAAARMLATLARGCRGGEADALRRCAAAAAGVAAESGVPMHSPDEDAPGAEVCATTLAPLPRGGGVACGACRAAHAAAPRGGVCALCDAPF